jgi:hypothetical protein
VTIDNVFSFFMCALRYRVARRLAGSGALYWRRREFGIAMLDAATWVAFTNWLVALQFHS